MLSGIPLEGTPRTIWASGIQAIVMVAATLEVSAIDLTPVWSLRPRAHPPNITPCLAQGHGDHISSGSDEAHPWSSLSGFSTCSQMPPPGAQSFISLVVLMPNALKPPALCNLSPNPPPWSPAPGQHSPMCLHPSPRHAAHVHQDLWAWMAPVLCVCDSHVLAMAQSAVRGRERGS